MSEKSPVALVVEDDQPVRELLADVLSGEGYSTLEAGDGEEAIQLVDELILPANVPCVVVLDMMLPDVSGLGVLDHLQAQGARVPVVAISASMTQVAAARAAGTQAALAKPFDLYQLVALVAHSCAPANN
jgi:CheY-like chemotaxis protein